jgi:hypothetical protein
MRPTPHAEHDFRSATRRTGARALAADFRSSRPAISKLLRVLCEAGLVIGRRPQAPLPDQARAA